MVHTQLPGARAECEPGTPLPAATAKVRSTCTRHSDCVCKLSFSGACGAGIREEGVSNERKQMGFMCGLQPGLCAAASPVSWLSLMHRPPLSRCQAPTRARSGAASGVPANSR